MQWSVGKICWMLLDGADIWENDAVDALMEYSLLFARSSGVDAVGR